jgi:hypothetical protein
MFLKKELVDEALHLGSLDPKQHPYKLVTAISSKEPKDALDKAFEQLDLIDGLEAVRHSHLA